MRGILTITLLGLLTVVGAWDLTFKSSKCYPDTTSQYMSADPIETLTESRMPLSMANFISLLEKYETQHSMFNPDRIADSLILRYKKDGTVYDPEHAGGLMFYPREKPETDKQDILTKILSPSYEVPLDTFDHREECALHFMLSHSTDTYPYQSVNDFWEDGQRRYRRQADQRFSSYNLPSGIEPSLHPIENGVVLSNSGPVALGTLLSGIASSIGGNEQTIATIFGTEVDYMPDEMRSVRLNPIYTATLAGDIGQAALKAAFRSSTSQYYVGPYGMFSNSTAAPKLFSLSDGYNGDIAYVTRAEIFAGIDAILIQKYLSTNLNSQTKLSQTLRMYYSDRGLPNNPNYKACNRIEAYKSLQDDVKTKEQALNFMYAYSDLDPLAQQLVTENNDNFPEIETHFNEYLNNVWNAVNSFISSYSYDDYDTCPVYSSSYVKCENTVDLVVVYNREGGYQDTLASREYITRLAEMVGVGQDRSRLGVVDSRDASWLMPMTNVSNIADLGSNFTMNNQQFGSGGSSTDMLTILDTLRTYYFGFYNVTNSTAANATAHSQVVVWNVPRTAPDFNDRNVMKTLWDFRTDFPNVYFLLVGSSIAEWETILADRQRDFFKVDLLDTEGTAKKIADRVCQIPSMFVYPACNTDIPGFSDYNEDSHLFRGYISPNYTTYAMIAPHNFIYSYRTKIKLQSNDIQLCSSRVSQNVESTAEDYECLESSNTERLFTELCADGNVTKCNPIYLSITGIPTTTPRCTAEECEYPNQVEFRIGHEGLVCGASSFSVSLLLLVLLALLHVLWA